MRQITTLCALVVYSLSFAQTYKIVDTGVTDFYSSDTIIAAPSSGEDYYGQDATYSGHQPSYTDNGDGTITDNVTGLMWEKNMGDKITFDAAFTKASNSTLGNYTDWRVPTIKELFSLALFTGRCFGENVIDKFIDTNYFDQPIGDTSIGEREIDAQTWSSTEYTGTTMGTSATVFGYNFVDGRLKGYPKYHPQTGADKTMYFRLVRNNTDYGINEFTDNSDGTITDSATGLMWQQANDGITRNWPDALSYAENLSLANHDDWRMPNAKELQSIVDYSRCPDATNSPAIDALFSCTTFNNPEGDATYGYYWTSSPLMDGNTPYTDAVYVCFGEGQGQMTRPPSNTPAIYDTHGAGAIRNDPKKMAVGTDYPAYWGPQGDIVYVNNYIRCVRNVAAPTNVANASVDGAKTVVYPNPTTGIIHIKATENNINKVAVADAKGHIISDISLEQSVTSVNISHLAEGMYIIYIHTQNEVLVKKVLKQ